MITQNQEKDIIDFLKDLHEDNLIAIYGIGSEFFSNFSNKTPVDCIVILSNTLCLARKDYTTALFEDYKISDFDCRCLYGTLNDYKNEVKFKDVSFSNYAWSINSLKSYSKLLYGKDIRNELIFQPFTEKAFLDIFKHVSYHINRSLTTKNEPDIIRLTKCIFKAGFLITALDISKKADVQYTDYLYGISEIYEYLVQMQSQNKVSMEFINIYKDAIDIRTNQISYDDVHEFIEYRNKVITIYFDECAKALNMQKKRLKVILKDGFNHNGFNVILSVLNKNAFV